MWKCSGVNVGSEEAEADLIVELEKEKVEKEELAKRVKNVILWI